MKYYVVSDIHGFFTEFHQALTQAGFFNDAEPHKLVVLGDLFDRGQEAIELQSFVLELMGRDEVILIRGNHEDMFEEMVVSDHCVPFQQYIRNGTYDTALQLTGYDQDKAIARRDEFVEAVRQTTYFQRIIPAMSDYYETSRYVFVHGWIPCVREKNQYIYYKEWRVAPEAEWDKARWYNGIDAAMTSFEEKTIVCGHWHTSYGHSKYLRNGTEFGIDACFGPYCNTNIIAIDACTAHSGIVNVLVLEDEEKDTKL